MYNIVYVAFEVLNWLIIARVLLSWVNHNPYNPIIKFVYEITEPIMAPFRRLIPMGPVDFSPIITILVLQFAKGIILDILIRL